MAIKNDDDRVQRLNDEYHAEKQNRAEELLLPKAKRGEWSAIRNLLEIYTEALDDGSPLTPKHAAYLAEALRKIARGDDHIAAFGIQRKPGEKDTQRARIKALRNAYRLGYMQSQGKSLGKARETIVDENTGISDEALKKQWKKYGKRVKRAIDNQKQRFGAIVPPEAIEFTFDKLAPD